MYQGYNLLCGTGMPPGTATSTSAIASKLGREGLGTEIFFKTISKSKSSSSLLPSSPATPRCQMEIVKAGFSNDQIQNCINQGFREAFLLNWFVLFCQYTIMNTFKEHLKHFKIEMLYKTIWPTVLERISSSTDLLFFVPMQKWIHFQSLSCISIFDIIQNCINWGFERPSFSTNLFLFLSKEDKSKHLKGQLGPMLVTLCF